MTSSSVSEYLLLSNHSRHISDNNILPTSHVITTRDVITPRASHHVEVEEEGEGKNEADDDDATMRKTATTRQLHEDESMKGSSVDTSSAGRRRVSFSENISTKSDSSKLTKTRSFSSGSCGKPPILAPKPFFAATGRQRTVKSVTSVVVESNSKFVSKSTNCNRTTTATAKSLLKEQREEKTATKIMPNEVVAEERQTNSDVTVVANETSRVDDDGDEGELFTSVSARRGKFELKINKGGNHDNTTPDAASSSPTMSNAAKSLFKDILQMKDLGGLERTKQNSVIVNPLKQHTKDVDGGSAFMRDVMIGGDIKPRDQQQQEDEDDWFKNIPLPPLALQPSSPPPLYSSTPPSAYYPPNHSSGTPDADDDDEQRRITRNHSTVTDDNVEKKQCNKDPSSPSAPPIPPKSVSSNHQHRSLEEEILYYDNMDIMEKVREQKSCEREEQGESKKKEKPTTTTAVVRDEREAIPQEVVNGCEDKKSDYEIHQAIGKLEEQFNKLTKQMATFQDSPVPTAVHPPKLPPKQHRFNRQQAINKQQQLQQQKQQTSDHEQPQSLDERFKIHQQLLQQQQRKKEELSNLQRQKRENEERRQTEKNSVKNTQQQQTEKNSVKNTQHLPLTSPRPSTNGSFFTNNGFSPEDVRARALVDEPLAPIIEEGSACEDSSCTSSVTGDDFSTQADSYSCVNGSTSLGGSSTWSPASSRRNLTDDDAGVATETETAEDDDDDGKTTPSDGEVSDADSVRWQSNPMSPTNSKTTKKKISFSTSSDVGTIRRQRSTKSESVSRRPSQDSLHSWKSSDCAIDDNESTFSDVAPYGMVDLTKFEPTYHAEKQQQQQQKVDEVLTPHSILTSVQDFNSTLNRHRVANKHSNVPDESELPSFPLQINNGTTTSGNKTWSKTMKRKKQQQQQKKPPNEEILQDGIGYDNLENYGGEDRRAAKQDQQQQQTEKSTTKVVEKPTPKPRGGELANVTASRLARHSSAVTALDRHSNNLKRNSKQSSVVKQQQKQTENKSDTRIQQQDSNRRRKVSRSSTSSEASCTEGKHLEGRSIRITRQNSTTSSLSDTTQSGSSVQLHKTDDNLVNPYEEVSLVKSPKEIGLLLNNETKDQQINVETSDPKVGENKEEINGLEDTTSSQSLVEVTDTSLVPQSSLFNGDEDLPQPAPRSLGSQLRNFLSGNPENKYISPSLRRKRSLLKRSKSPGGSRRSRTPPRSKSSVSDSGKEAEEDTISTGSQRKEKRNEKQKRNKVKEEEDNKEEEEEPPKEIIRKERSASQRLVDRRGRSKKSQSFRRSEGDLEKKGENSEEKKKKMGSRWRRSKSQDRVSPSRSKSKERKLGRSKSTERPMAKEGETNNPSNNEQEERGRSRNIFKRSRSSSRKRDGRGKSSERKEDGGGGRGRNPVSFFRKLLKKRESDNEEEVEEESIVQVPLGETRSRSGSSEALSTILAYKNSDTKAEKGSWTPPRPSSSVQRAINNNSARNSDVKYKNKKSPMKHHNGPASTENFSTCSRSHNQQNRRQSLTNSTPSSDSDNYHRPEVLAHPTFMQKRSLRRKLLLAREYDSDTSALASDIDNSLRPGLSSNTIKSSLRKPKRNHRNSPRRPVRVVSPRRSQSEPTLVDTDHTYYNVERNDVFRYPPTQNSGHTNERATEDSIKSRVGEVDKSPTPNSNPHEAAYTNHQRKNYKTLVSLNAQTLKKISERRLVEWRNQLPVGGFLITSWSDVALSSHRPLCMIGNSVVYGAVSNGNNKFNLACQLYEYRKMDNKILQKIECCTSLPTHPNVCGICSHFVCRLPRSLLDPSSGGGAADAICIVLSNRPKETIEDNLERVLNQGDSTEYHRQILLTILQLIQGVNHLYTNGFQPPPINADQIITTVDHGFAQILPHLAFCDATATTNNNNNKKQKSKTTEKEHQDTSHTQQLAQLIKRLLQKGATGSRLPGDRNSTSSTSGGSRVVVPGTKYSSAIKHTIQFLQRSIMSGENLQRAAQVIQCALWGPEDLDDVGINDVTPLMALELWVEMEEAKLVNNLAVLSSNDRLTPVTMMKHGFFAHTTPQMLLDGLKILQRI